MLQIILKGFRSPIGLKLGKKRKKISSTLTVNKRKHGEKGEGKLRCNNCYSGKSALFSINREKRLTNEGIQEGTSEKYLKNQNGATSRNWVL